jgi:hypothetical protein
MHNYLEDTLSPMQYNWDYIYKLIYLLCLPEMVCYSPYLRKALLLHQHEK